VPLGQLPDTTLGRWLKASKFIVRAYRRWYGLEPCEEGSLVDWSRLPLGEISDTHVATLTGLSTVAVCRMRNEMGITPCEAHKRTGLPPRALDPSEFVRTPVPVRLKKMVSPPPRAGRYRSLWDRADEAMQVLADSRMIEIDDLLRRSRVRLEKATCRQAQLLLEDLRWVQRGDAWISPQSDTKHADVADASVVSVETLSPSRRCAVRWASSRSTGSSRYPISRAELVDAGDVRHVSTKKRDLYFFNPTDTSQEHRTRTRS
jgi:hypothetical protein